MSVTHAAGHISGTCYRERALLLNGWVVVGCHPPTQFQRKPMTMCFLTVSSRPCLETNPHSILRTPFAGHCLGALWGGKPCPAELSEGVNRVLRTLSGDPPLPILQTPSAGHCLDTHGMILRTSRTAAASLLRTDLGT